MRVFKWDNGLAIRLPASVVDVLGLKDGDEIEVHVAGARTLGVARDHAFEDALERIRSLSKQLPADWKFDRDQANTR